MKMPRQVLAVLPYAVHADYMTASTHKVVQMEEDHLLHHPSCTVAFGYMEVRHIRLEMGYRSSCYKRVLCHPINLIGKLGGTNFASATANNFFVGEAFVEVTALTPLMQQLLNFTSVCFVVNDVLMLKLS